jgi:hypothetical protein
MAVFPLSQGAVKLRCPITGRMAGLRIDSRVADPADKKARHDDGLKVPLHME